MKGYLNYFCNINYYFTKGIIKTKFGESINKFVLPSQLVHEFILYTTIGVYNFYLKLSQIQTLKLKNYRKNKLLLNADLNLALNLYTNV